MAVFWTFVTLPTSVNIICIEIPCTELVWNCIGLLTLPSHIFNVQPQRIVCGVPPGVEYMTLIVISTTEDRVCGIPPGVEYITLIDRVCGVPPGIEYMP